MPDDGDLVLTVGGQELAGWQKIEVTCGLEGMPWTFDVSVTEKFPAAADAVVNPGDPCVVSIGGDTVITGYVDRYMPALEPAGHTIRVVGRSKSCDFVDCSAEWPGGQIMGSSALEITTKLAAPYGITVKGEVDTGPPIPQFNLTLGESAYAIAERICRYRGVLLVDDPSGAIALTQAGSGQMASGVKEGDNVQACAAVYAIDGRYSDYNCYAISVDDMADAGGAGNLKFVDQDQGVKRHRLLDIIAESGDSGFEILQQRGRWETARRWGRGYQLLVTVDSWRDSAGALWRPNFKIPVELPTIKAPKLDWLISMVTFRRDIETGTTASLELMPRQAFLPEPVLLVPLFNDAPGGGVG